MKVDLKTYLIAGCVAAVAIAISIGSLWSNHKIAVLEQNIENAKADAAEKQSVANQREQEAGEYKAKNEYLEQQVADLQAVAKKQDEQLETLSKTTDSAREHLERTRRVQSVAATADDLCAKLADLGHPCR